MTEKTNKVFKEYTWSLRAFLDIDVHRIFYNNIMENEEITLVCNEEKVEIITTKGFKFPVFSIQINNVKYFYYAIKAGAVFRGYITNICKNGAFNIHISQYVYDGYKDPEMKIYTEAFTNVGLGKTYYRSSMRYEQDIKEEKRKMSLYSVVTIVFFVLLFTVGPISSSFATVLVVSFILLIIIELLNTTFKGRDDLNLELQIYGRIHDEKEKIKKDNEERRRKIQEEHRKEQARQQQIKRDNEERQRKIQEEEYRREYEKTHENSISLIKSLSKPDKYGNIQCPKCCSIVTAKYGFCPKCRTKFKLDVLDTEKTT